MQQPPLKQLKFDSTIFCLSFDRVTHPSIKDDGTLRNRYLFLESHDTAIYR